MHSTLPVPANGPTLVRLALLAATIGLSGMGCSQPEPEADAGRTAPPFAVPNDNRTPAGTVHEGVLELSLEARLVRWKGEQSDLGETAPDPSILTVLAFAEEDNPPSIPGPLIRVSQGTEVHVRVRNSIPDPVSIGLPGPALRTEKTQSVAADVLVVRGLRAGTVEDDELRIARGETGEVSFRADVPGTFFYWGTPSERSIESWTGIDAQLAGAIVVDPEGTVADPEERIFVITMIDQLVDPDSELPPADYFRRAINGLSWPDTERFQYEVGETIRWRWINASFESHPMHLHGFHYRLTARGDWKQETLFEPDQRPLIVTEHMAPGTTFRMEWQPTRAGNWIFHCHFIDHIVPTMERTAAERAHDVHDVEQHPLDAMGGLVLGMTVTDPAGDEPDPAPGKRLRLVALERPKGELIERGFALAPTSAPEPGPEDLSAPGPPLLLTRGETTEIEVLNRLSEPTTIHWHGLELLSVYDGVAGWSRTGTRVAPLIAPGESFAVRIAPPRAGTFIYHTHMDETDQLAQGMMGAFLVLEPGEEHDPEHDRLFLIAGMTDGDEYPVTINGEVAPPAQTFEAGVEHRLRIVHLSRGVDAQVSLLRDDGTPVVWRAIAKDGADLPPGLQVESTARLRTHTGETFDFAWTPSVPGDARFVVRYDRFFSKETVEVVQPLRIRRSP